MYKTSVYRLVSGGITRLKQQIQDKGILHSMTLPKYQCTID